jgi:tetratricopeptide (TPR) repeat protein
MFFARNARAVAGVFTMLLLTACSTTQQIQMLRSSPPAHLPARAELTQVAFYPQQEHQCGPASLAMALQNAGVNVEPQQLTSFVYLPEKQGSLQVEMLAAARRHGMVAYLLPPKLEDVLVEIAAGNPVVVLQNLGLSWYPVWHYAVAVGYDLRSEQMILRSGHEFRQILPFFTFESTWARSNYWAMVVLPPGRLPQTATPETYIPSIAALEHSSPESDVWPAYTAAMQRWPDSLAAKIAAGNYAYNRNNLTLAEQLFLEAAQAHPDSVAAYNNLAQTLSDLGKYEAALVAARRAVEIGGSLESMARGTLEEIEQQKMAHDRGK